MTKRVVRNILGSNPSTSRPNVRFRVDRAAMEHVSLRLLWFFVTVWNHTPWV